jgi:hypothetical protein
MTAAVAWHLAQPTGEGPEGGGEAQQAAEVPLDPVLGEEVLGGLGEGEEEPGAEAALEALRPEAGTGGARAGTCGPRRGAPGPAGPDTAGTGPPSPGSYGRAATSHPILSGDWRKY